MIFLVGAMRSGTNWLQRMLATHPLIVPTPGETHLFSHGLVQLREIVHHGVADSPATASLYMDPDVFRDAIRDFCDVAYRGLLERSSGSPEYVLDRTPHHVYAVDL